MLAHEANLPVKKLHSDFKGQRALDFLHDANLLGCENSTSEFKSALALELMHDANLPGKVWRCVAGQSSESRSCKCQTCRRVEMHEHQRFYTKERFFQEHRECVCNGFAGDMILSRFKQLVPCSLSTQSFKRSAPVRCRQFLSSFLFRRHRWSKHLSWIRRWKVSSGQRISTKRSSWLSAAKRCSRVQSSWPSTPLKKA